MGMRIRKIKTLTQHVDGKDVIVPDLDANGGQEQELWSVEIPIAIEAGHGVPSDVIAQGKEAIEAYITDELQRLADLDEET